MVLKALTDKLQGRHTAAVTVFSTVGTLMHWFHRLDSVYMQFVGMMMGFILAHSVKEDIANKDKTNAA